MCTYSETLDVKVEIQGLDDHRGSFTQSEPAGGAELLPANRPGSERETVRTLAHTTGNLMHRWTRGVYKMLRP